MAIGLALAGAGMLASAFGNKNKGAKPAQSGFNALPKAVQDAWLENYVPDVMSQYNAGYQGVPMSRVEAPTDVFGSQALYDLQQFSDNVGGFFSPLQAPQDNGLSAFESLPAIVGGMGANNIGVQSQGQQSMAGNPLFGAATTDNDLMQLLGANFSDSTRNTQLSNILGQDVTRLNHSLPSSFFESNGQAFGARYDPNQDVLVNRKGEGFISIDPYTGEITDYNF